jgi:curved DNA-binding protein CbpA
MNHYKILGVEPDATDIEIKNAYKNKAKKYHPDVSDDCEIFAHKKMQKINEAYAVLSDNAKREEYDYSLWREKKNNPGASDADRFGYYNPFNTETQQKAKPNTNQNYRRKKSDDEINIFKYIIRVPQSKKDQRTMRIVWTVRVVLTAIMLFAFFGIMTHPSTVDRIYGRGTPAQVTRMFFDSLKERDFERTEQLTGGAMYNVKESVQRVYNFETYGVRYGEILFGNMEKDLKVRVRRTERMDFSSASVNIRLTNIDMEKLFLQAERAIRDDIDKGVGELVLRQAITNGDISLVPEIYAVYFKKYKPENLTAEIKLTFFRPNMWWQVAGADNRELLLNVILGGFGEAVGNNFEGYILIDWGYELGIGG